MTDCDVALECRGPTHVGTLRTGTSFVTTQRGKACKPTILSQLSQHQQPSYKTLQLATIMASREAQLQLTKEEVRSLGDVRRSVWKGGFYGFCYGSVGSLALHEMAQYARRRGLFPSMKVSPSSRLFAVLAGGALGSFVMSYRAGTKEVSNMYPVFESRSNRRLTPYQEQVLAAKKQQQQQQQAEDAESSPEQIY